MASALDIPGILGLLDRGDTVLLPTQLAVRVLRDRFDRQQAARGLHAWEPAPISTLGQWTESLWGRLIVAGHEDRVLLNRLQEQALWADLIAARPEGAHLATGPLQDIAALADSALSLATAHISRTHLQRALETAADNFDSRCFAAWCPAFLTRCDQSRLLSRALLESALELHAQAGHLSPSGPVHVIGFDSLTPAQSSLLAQLRTARFPIQAHTLTHSASTAPNRGAIRADTPQAELRWAARWLREHQGQHAPGGLTVGLILPDPAADRAALEPILREVLAPELQRIDVDLSSTPWHFHAGPPLATVPIISDVLLALRWTRAPLHVDEVSRILLSPCFGHTDSPEARARLDMYTLRDQELLRPELSLSAVLRRAQGAQLSLPELHAFASLAGEPGQLTGTGSFADWAELVRKLLRALGWPGPGDLSAAQFRATEAWETLLDSLSTLDLHGRRPTFSTFLQTLEREAQTMLVSEPSEGARIQIARLSDFEGCVLDTAILLHSTDGNLPVPERPHPLFGWSLQQRLELPGTDSASTHARSRHALHSLAARCGDFLVVAAGEDEHGPLRLTPLASELGLPTRNSADLLAPEAIHPPLALEALPDSQPLPPLPDFRVKGGSTVLELQAACGFRAFAALRLQATAPESPGLGMDRREAGTVLHGAMALLWERLGSRASLAALPEDQRLALVQECVGTAFQRFRSHPSDDTPWASAYLDVLERRLIHLILHWLPLETARAEFTVVAREEQQILRVGPLELSVRLDRIDKVENGFVFIDYKTAGDLKAAHWLGERPDAPQLPLYTCLAEPDEVRAIAFARLRPGEEAAWIGLQDQLGIFPSKKRDSVHDFHSQVALWRAELDRLAHAFANGEAQIDPKLYPDTCQYCNQRLLCRISPLTHGAAQANRESEVPIG